MAQKPASPRRFKASPLQERWLPGRVSPATLIASHLSLVDQLVHHAVKGVRWRCWLLLSRGLQSCNEGMAELNDLNRSGSFSRVDHVAVGISLPAAFRRHITLRVAGHREVIGPLAFLRILVIESRPSAVLVGNRFDNVARGEYRGCPNEQKQ